MRFSRSLRKTIAASLTFTMLAIPLAGCSRTVTTGGLTGRGILGDFLIGGFYGGFLGGFLCPGKPLPKGAFVVELPRPNDLRLTTELVGMDALRYYTHARIATEKLSRMNKDNSTPEEYARLLKETAELWKLADYFADMAEKFAHLLAKEEKKPDYKPLAMIDHSPFGKDIFFSVAHAREGTDKDEKRHAPTPSPRSRVREEIKEGSIQWASEIIKTYERFPAGHGIEGLSKELCLDTKEANRQFQQAIQVFDQDKLFGFTTGISSQKAGDIYKAGTQAAMVTKTGCQVILCVGGMILSGGALAGAGMAKQTLIVTNMVASFADTSADIANTGHEIIYDKEDAQLAEIKKTTGIISAVTSGVTIVTSFGDFALRGKDAVENTHKALEAANVGEYGLFNKFMNTSGVLDKYNIGGEGVSAILDSAIWTGERVQDFVQEGEFLGFKIFGGDDGRLIFLPTSVSKGSHELPRPIDQVAAGTVDIWMMKEETEERQKAVKALLEAIEDLDKKKHDILQNEAQRAQKETESLLQKEASKIKEIIEEDAKRRREIAEDEARREKERRQEKPEAKEYARDPRFPAYVPHPSVSNDMGGGAPSNNRGGGTAGKTEQQRPEEPSYTPSRMAGYYTVTTAKGDMAMRVVLKATGENTLRVIEVQQRSDKKGKGKYTITIDPKTGKGKTDKGNTVRFEVKRDGVTFMGTLEEGSGIWRFVKH